MPLNCFDATFRSFEECVLPELHRRGIAPLGMKSMGGSGEMVRMARLPPRGPPICHEPARSHYHQRHEFLTVLKQNLEIARGFQPLSAAEMQRLRDRCRPDAADGRWELFKTTKKYDGDAGRKQHGFPSADDLPA